MGVGVADYDCDGNFDLVKSNFAGDTTSLYHNQGDGFFEDRTFQAGLGRITRFLGWERLSWITTTMAGPISCFATVTSTLKWARA